MKVCFSGFILVTDECTDVKKKRSCQCFHHARVVVKNHFFSLLCFALIRRTSFYEGIFFTSRKRFFMRQFFLAVLLFLHETYDEVAEDNVYEKMTSYFS